MIDRIRDQGAIVYMPHPFDRMRRSAIRDEEIARKAERIYRPAP